MSFLNIFCKGEKSKSIEKDLQLGDTFVLALVHKLRTPLNGARWALDSAIHSGDKDKNNKILTEGYDKILLAINTVNEILKMSEINSKDKFGFKMEKLDLCLVINDILKNLDFLIKKNEITLEYDNECGSVVIYANKEILDIGLTNIIDNAFKYSPKGKVTINLSKDGNIAKLIIKDNGIGVDKEDLKHMFEKFYRGKNAVSLDSKESGVGLFFTKKIIEIHRGSISMKSEINKGTTIEVKLPTN